RELRGFVEIYGSSISHSASAWRKITDSVPQPRSAASRRTAETSVSIHLPRPVRRKIPDHTFAGPPCGRCAINPWEGHDGFRGMNAFLMPFIASRRKSQVHPGRNGGFR